MIHTLLAVTLFVAPSDEALFPWVPLRFESSGVVLDPPAAELDQVAGWFSMNPLRDVVIRDGILENAWPFNENTETSNVTAIRWNLGAVIADRPYLEVFVTVYVDRSLAFRGGLVAAGAPCDTLPEQVKERLKALGSLRDIGYAPRDLRMLVATNSPPGLEEAVVQCAKRLDSGDVALIGPAVEGENVWLVYRLDPTRSSQMLDVLQGPRAGLGNAWVVLHSFGTKRGTVRVKISK